MTMKNDKAPFLNLSDISSVDDLKVEEVYVDEWKGNVRVKVLSGELRPQIEELATQTLTPAEAYEQFIIKMVVLATVDEAGNQLFSDNDVAMLKQKNPIAVTKVCNAAVKINMHSDCDFEEPINK